MRPAASSTQCASISRRPPPSCATRRWTPLCLPTPPTTATGRCACLCTALGEACPRSFKRTLPIFVTHSLSRGSEQGHCDLPLHRPRGQERDQGRGCRHDQPPRQPDRLFPAARARRPPDRDGDRPPSKLALLAAPHVSDGSHRGLLKRGRLTWARPPRVIKGPQHRPWRRLPEPRVLTFLAGFAMSQAANVSKNPILMADLLKFMLTFRNQLPKEAYAVMFPILNVLPFPSLPPSALAGPLSASPLSTWHASEHQPTGSMPPKLSSPDRMPLLHKATSARGRRPPPDSALSTHSGLALLARLHRPHLRCVLRRADADGQRWRQPPRQQGRPPAHAPAPPHKPLRVPRPGLKPPPPKTLSIPPESGSPSVAVDCSSPHTSCPPDLLLHGESSLSSSRAIALGT